MIDNKPEMYSQITLQDGRIATVVDYLHELIIVDTVDAQKEWTTLAVIRDSNGEFISCEEDYGVTYQICPRKGVRLHISEDKIYTFLLAYKYDDEYFSMTEKQFYLLCGLLGINTDDLEQSWFHYFEYNNYTPFLNAYKIVTADDFYYAYGYDAAEKTADALYRFHDGSFERYFPREGIWREMPEQKMILKENKPRYERVSEQEGMSLALLV